MQSSIRTLTIYAQSSHKAGKPAWPLDFNEKDADERRSRYTGKVANARRLIMNTQLITVDPEIHSGTPVFKGTRVPIRTLFDHLEAGDSLSVFLDDFPSVSRELAVAILEEALAALVPDAHPA